MNNRITKFSYLTRNENNFFINRKKTFKLKGYVSDDGAENAERFADQMTFGNAGEHRKHRTGGSDMRFKRQIYEDTLRGKLAEVALYEFFLTQNLQPSEPDFQTFPLGKWDSFDYKIAGKKLNVKSTKHFGNLFLLETGDWNGHGQYVPNIKTNESEYDYFVLIRIIENEDRYGYDIPGYFERNDLNCIIKNNYILLKSSYLNGRIRMDAENYYIQSGDLIEIDELITLFTSV